VREIVIVVTDLYLEPQLTGRLQAAAVQPSPALAALSEASAAPGLEHLARFAGRKALREGWRTWVARWLGLAQYAGEAPASVAAAPLAGALARRAVWIATPLHLIAGLSSLHFDRRSILHLAPGECAELAVSFRDTFRDSGFDLHPLADGGLILSAPAGTAPAVTTEPARMLLTSIEAALAVGEGSRALRRLSAEIEMWLHAHPLNARRAERGAPGIAALWLWGGGAPALSPRVASGELSDAAFGSDAYVQGLWRLAGGETRPMPVDWRAVIGGPRMQRALGVMEIAELLQTEASWSLADAVAEIDRRLISPSLDALRCGELERLWLLANDRCLSIRAADRWRLWRRKRTALEGLA